MAKKGSKQSEPGKSKIQGAEYYRNQNLKPILVHVPEGVYRVLKSEAETDLRSLEKTVRKILTDYANKSGKYH